ncbi:unnamed protein product [Bubo scandiacus]
MEEYILKETKGPRQDHDIRSKLNRGAGDTRAGMTSAWASAHGGPRDQEPHDQDETCRLARNGRTLLEKVEGTGRIKGLRTPPSVAPSSTPVTWNQDLSGAWSTITCAEPEPTEHRWIPGDGADMKVTQKSFNFVHMFRLPFYFVSAVEGTNGVKLFNDAIKSPVAYKQNSGDDMEAMRELERFVLQKESENLSDKEESCPEGKPPSA